MLEIIHYYYYIKTLYKLYDIIYFLMMRCNLKPMVTYKWLGGSDVT